MTKPRILILRRQPGLGDVIASTVAMRAAREKYGGLDGEFEVCGTLGLRRWVELFQDQPGIVDTWVSHELARESEESLAEQFEHVFSLDGPEFRHANHVGWAPMSRLEVWCDSVDHRPDDMSPRWKPRSDEFHWAIRWLSGRFVGGYKRNVDGGLVSGNDPLIILQALPDPGMPWKAWPHTMQLAMKLAADYRVLVLHDKPLLEYEYESGRSGFVFECGLDLRQLGSVLSLADLVVAPDSAFIHFAAAVKVKCLGLFGGTDGRETTKFYPNARFLQGEIDEKWLCHGPGKAPCHGMSSRAFWCSANPGQMGACMRDLSVETVHAEVLNILTGETT